MMGRLLQRVRLRNLHGADRTLLQGEVAVDVGCNAIVARPMTSLLSFLSANGCTNLSADRSAMPLLPTQQQQLDEAELVQHLIMLQAQQRQGGKEHKVAGSFRVDRPPKGHIGGEILDRFPGGVEQWRADSVRRKRRHKMNKHKYRKRRKAQRHKN